MHKLQLWFTPNLLELCKVGRVRTLIVLTLIHIGGSDWLKSKMYNYAETTILICTKSGGDVWRSKKGKDYTSDPDTPIGGTIATIWKHKCTFMQKLHIWFTQNLVEMYYKFTSLLICTSQHIKKHDRYSAGEEKKPQEACNLSPPNNRWHNLY